MIDLPMRMNTAFDRRTVLSINAGRVQGAMDRTNIRDLNRNSNQNLNRNPNRAAGRESAPVGTPASAGGAGERRPSQNMNVGTDRRNMAAPGTGAAADRPVPALVNAARKGQKLSLEAAGKPSAIEVCLGWNVKNPACDVDVSAFLLKKGRVIGDSWFVFYGQRQSPDGSTVFSESDGADREIVSIDLARLNPEVDRIVFVLTINEALQRQLNFSMIKDAYIRILDKPSGRVLVSFMMDEYYENVTSMMIGEVYRHNNMWKFNAVGNGVARDLAGLCELYGVQVEE